MAGLFKILPAVLSRNMNQTVSRNFNRGIRDIAKDKTITIAIHRPGIVTQKFKMSDAELMRLAKNVEAAMKAKRKKLIEEIEKRSREFFS